MHGPHSIQIAYDDPLFGPLAMGGVVGADRDCVMLAWSGLGRSRETGPSRWQARLFDEHASLLEERQIASTVVARLLGGVEARLVLARAQALA